MRICPRCGETYDDDARNCGMDGTRLAPMADDAADDDAIFSTFGELPSGQKIALVVPEQPAKRARPRPPTGLRSQIAFATTGRNLSPAPAVAHAQPVDATQTTIAGRYQVESVIGEGGFGQIFCVRHVQLGKQFALKRINVDASKHPKVREAFYREAQLASSLDHPNIVSIVDFGEDPAVGAFMVMELLQGESLSDRIDGDRKPSLRHVLDVLLQVAEALHYIHDHGIVHGDIKPENILLCETHRASERRQWTVKLLDFGIARMDAETKRTTESIEGTPAYMAPERIKGNAPTPAVDLYALGILAYHLITGSVPFEGNVFEVLNAHCTRPPPSLASRTDEPIDERVEALVMRALAKDPAERQADMTAFIYELRTVMEMLGYRAGRRKRARVRRPSIGKDRRMLGERVGYQVCPMPMTGMDVDGTVVVANRAFARFLLGDENGATEGIALFESVLAEVYPQLAADVARVHKTGAVLQRTLDIWDADGRALRLKAWLVPGVEDAGKVHLAIQFLDEADGNTAAGPA